MINFIKRIPPDKWKHFVVGIGMGVFFQAVFLYIFHLSILPASLWSLGFSIAVAYGFELFSLFTGKGHYELMDAVAGVLGALIGMAAMALVIH